MAQTTSQLCLDQRWGGHLDIGKNGNVIVPLKKMLDQYTIELWIRLKSYPIIRKVQRPQRQSLIDPQLLEIGNVRVTYDNKKIKFKDGHTGQTVFVNYTAEEWFQLAITNGQVGQLGYDFGTIYINGKKLNETMVFPAEIRTIRIGNTLQKSDQIRINLKYPSNSSLGLVRVYHKILDQHEVYNNFLAQGRKYGLLMQTEAAPIKGGLRMELIADKGNVRHGHWYSTQCLRKRRLKESEKNIASRYNMDKELNELKNILQSIHGHARPSALAKPPSKTQKEVAGNIIVLSRNPEMFLRQLESPPDKVTKQLIQQTQAPPQETDYVSIFSNPFKLKLLVVYLQAQPKHFLSLLKSNVLTNEQLVLLHNAMQGQTAGATAAARPAIGGFQSNINPLQYNKYDAAMTLLENKIQGAPSQRETRSGLRQLATATGQIADIMNYNHAKMLHHERQAEKQELMGTIDSLNNRVTDTNKRFQKLEELLARQRSLLGLMISKRNGKCVGAIDRKGKIKHCAHRDAQSPYDIIVNKDVYQLNLGNILRQHQMHGATVKTIAKQVATSKNMSLLGQCINAGGKTIGLIVRQDKANHYIPTVESEPMKGLPILAILTPNSTSASKGLADALKSAVRRKGCARCCSCSSKKCPSGKCKPGFVAEESAAAQEEWLKPKTLSESVSVEEASQSQAERKAQEEAVEEEIKKLQKRAPEAEKKAVKPFSEEEEADVEEDEEAPKGIMGRIGSMLPGFGSSSSAEEGAEGFIPMGF